MSEFKNYETEDKQLKRADAKKAGVGDAAESVSDLLGAKKVHGNVTMMPVTNRKRKKTPIVVDIIVGILMLALVAGVIIGAYLLFTYYSGDYSGVDVEYTVICGGEDLASFASLSNGELYCDVEGNALYFGKVQSIKQEEIDGEEMFILKVALDDVRFKDGEGYWVSSERLAVGATYNLRCEKMEIEGTVVGLARVNKGAK